MLYQAPKGKETSNPVTGTWDKAGTRTQETGVSKTLHYQGYMNGASCQRAVCRDVCRPACPVPDESGVAERAAGWSHGQEEPSAATWVIILKHRVNPTLHSQPQSSRHQGDGLHSGTFWRWVGRRLRTMSESRPVSTRATSGLMTLGKLTLSLDLFIWKTRLIKIPLSSSLYKNYRACKGSVLPILSMGIHCINIH